jgi:hypothetical protein
MRKAVDKDPLFNIARRFRKGREAWWEVRALRKIHPTGVQRRRANIINFFCLTNACAILSHIPLDFGNSKINSNGNP